MNAVTSVNTGMNSLLQSSRFVPSQAVKVSPFGIVTGPATLEEIGLHYYPFHIGDYVRDTARLSLIEDIAYRRLLDVYYSKERPLNGCSTDVALEIGLQDYQPEVERVLKKYFIRDGDNWINGRVEREIQAYRDKQEKASKAGKASGRARRNKRSTDVEQTLNQPITINHKPITNGNSLSLINKTTLEKSGWVLGERQINALTYRRPDLVDRVFEVEDSFRFHFKSTGEELVDWDARWEKWLLDER